MARIDELETESGGLKARLDNRQRYENAVAVLSSYAQLGAVLIEEIYDCFQLSPIPPDRWEAAHRAWATWVVDMKQVILEQCPQYLGEFESFPVGGDFFDRANGRRNRLAEIMRQLRLAMERS